MKDEATDVNLLNVCCCFEFSLVLCLGHVVWLIRSDSMRVHGMSLIKKMDLRLPMGLFDESMSLYLMFTAGLYVFKQATQKNGLKLRASLC